VPTPYEQLFENNRAWVQAKLAQDPQYFERLAGSQAPTFLFIGCSDSRVPAEHLTGVQAGEMFVHRNIANVVVRTDMNLMSVVQYAVEELGVEHIIVCGHYGCGGVKAAVDGLYHGLIDSWLHAIKDVYRLHRDELDVITDAEQRHRRLVELNVREQVYKLCSTPVVQQAWHDQRSLHVHGWAYDIAEGVLRDLHIDAAREFDAAAIYDYDELTRGLGDPV
jgi:carbonic anhydrase